MSESDDTDVLLLIPPDFFLVHSSDSEDSFDPEVRDKYTDKHDFERLVVNDLISQVNELENRICVIENKNSLLDISKNPWEESKLNHSFDYSTTLDSNGYQYMRFKELPLKSQSIFVEVNKFGGSTENFKSLHSTPVKRKQSSSLPSTPSCEISGHNILPFSNVPKNDGDMLSPRGRNAIIIERMTPSEILSMSHPVLDKSAPSDGHKQQLKNSNLLGEIDHFLHSVKKNPRPPNHSNVSEHIQKQEPYLCGEILSTIPDCNFGLRDFNSLPVREEPIKTKHIASLVKDNTEQFKQIHPEEVNHFVSSIGDDTKNVNHLQFLNQQKNVFIYGDNENFVQDSGYSLKSFHTLPIREEIKPKNIVPPQTYPMAPEIKGLELSDIEKLLKQMEATQYEIEKKLQLREALLGKSSNTSKEESYILPPGKVSAAADTVNSVPDRGSGVRGILYPSKTDSLSNSALPGDGGKIPGNISKVHEEPFTERIMSLVGSEIPPPEAGSASDNQLSIETVHSQEQISTVQEQASNIPLVKRKLELGGDVSAIPDLGFGLKNWYQNDTKSHVRCAHNIPHPHTSSINQKLINTVTANKERHTQGEYVASIPDVGFGLRSLWGNDRILETSSIPKLPHSSSHPQQAYRDRDMKSIECALLSQVEVPDIIGDGTRSRMYQCHDPNAQSQTSLLSEPHKGSAMEEATIKKKVNFTVSSGQGDSLPVQQDYGVDQHIIEDARSKTELQSSFPDSGLATSLRLFDGFSSGSGNLLSLSELWGKEAPTSGSLTRDEQVNVRIKLEEEKYRRQHCERLIHQLQSRLLEEQQKLAVAVEVDKGKDQAIIQLQDAWFRLAQHWKELEEHRHSLANRLQNEREAHQRQESEWVQKIKQLECELSKALDLAQGYKDKFDAVEKEKFELLEIHKGEIETRIHKIQEVEEKLDKANHLHSQLVKENNDYVEKATQAEQATQKERKLLIDAQKELGNMHKKLESFEAEISGLKEERDTIQLKLKEEKGRINILDQQKKSLQSSLDESKKKEKSVRDEIKQLSSQMDKMKVELRKYYQEQLEIVVRDKLLEFQQQLDATETGLHRELEQRELAITEIASKQVKQISEKHQLEVQLLEEKHTEELHLYKLQLAQAMQQISQLEAKLQVHNSRKSEIVEKLHNVMETQWQEALRIISGNSPLVNIGTDHGRLLQRGDNLCKIGTGVLPLSNHKCGEIDKRKTIPDSKLLRVENEVEGWGPSKEKLVKTNKMVTSTPQNLPLASNAQSSFKDASQFHTPPIHVHDQSAESSIADESPFCQEGLLTSRKAEQTLQETPPTKGSAQSTYENELRKYIMMLLNRSPGNPVNIETDINHRLEFHNERKTQDECQEKKEEYSNIPTNETTQIPKWERILRQDSHCSLSSGKQQNIPSIPVFDLTNTGNNSTKDNRPMKPPWK